MTGISGMIQTLNFDVEFCWSKPHQYYSIKQYFPQEKKILNINFSNGYMIRSNADWSGTKIAHIIE